MNDGNGKASIEVGMKGIRPAQRTKSNGSRDGVQGEYVIVRWTNSDLVETAEYYARHDEVTPLAGWL